VSSKQDLSFSSASEIKSFINANKSGPNMTSSNTDLQKYREMNLIDEEGNRTSNSLSNDIDQTTVEFARTTAIQSIMKGYNFFLNPILYDGSTI
jgi:hypothetical protein